MKKNDKLIAVLGVAILILAAIGIYYWAEEPVFKKAEVEDFFAVTGVMKDVPEAIAVSDSCPFYALIATPIAINYDSEGYQNIIPLYIKNFKEPSRAIERTIDIIGISVDEEVKDGITPKELSLDYAKRFWKSSDGALLIEYTQEGYNLGVLATPLASYFSIPVIVCDEVDADIKEVLDNLGVERTIVCGDLEGYGDILKFEDPNDVVNASIKIVKEKFDELDYITITNPIDIHEPEVRGSISQEWEGTIQGFSLLPSQMKSFLTNFITAFTGSTAIKLGEIKIPEDYKYALIKFDGIAEYKGDEDPNDFGSSVAFEVSGDYEIFGSGLGTTAGIPIRDNEGYIIEDRVYSENVVYDLGGEEFKISAKKAVLFVSSAADVKVKVVIENLSDPLYPMMKKLSATAPYLTAYRQGIIFGKPEFAFVADDHIRTERDETCPGVYQVRSNHALQYACNKHIFDIHDQINDLLAKLAGIDLTGLGSLKELRDYYKEDPVYICLVGGNVVLPQFIYDSYLTPAGDNFISLKYGVGIPTDIIYGNIDPIPDKWDMITPDVYWDIDENFPYQENIVGRITGWDVQDANALIARTVFYEDILDMEEFDLWKGKATVQTGCGTDFLKPPIASLLRKLKGKDDIVKWWSGNTELTGDGIQKTVLEPLGFDVYRTKNTESQVKGFTDSAINKMASQNLLSRLFFGKRLTRKISGEETVIGGKLMEECNIIFQNAHGMPNGYEFGDAATNNLGYRPILYLLTNWASRAGSSLASSFSTGLTAHGSNNIRNIEYMELGPSVMIVESCFVGKIDGMYPKQALCQASIHAGVNALIASPTETNVPGGYLEPYLERGLKWDRFNIIGNIVNRLNARKGIYPTPHFGGVIYKDFYNYLGLDQDVGTALRNARNSYLPKDWDSTFKWVPPLAAGGVGLKPNVPEHKYLAYQEYCLYADPAFNPYLPNQ
ncbi:MAG: C25 family cysteine peptidase [Candidatus Thorarchaeota archaeon]